jgi:hypothetical protein
MPIVRLDGSELSFANRELAQNNLRPPVPRKNARANGRGDRKSAGIAPICCLASLGSLG